MKYGVYILKGEKVDTRMIQETTKHDNSSNWELVATARTKAEAKEIFKNLVGNFWN